MDMQPHKTTVCFDIDGTLFGKDYKPRKKIVELLKAMVKSELFEVYCWSGAGVFYAEQRIRDLKLPKEVKVFGIKQPHKDVDIAIDDMEIKFGKVNVLA